MAKTTKNNISPRASAAKVPRGRARKIFDLERPSSPEPGNGAYDELIAAEAAKAGITVDEWNERHWPPPSETPWSGGRERDVPGKLDELDALATRGLMAQEPLDILLLAVSRAHANRTAKKAGGYDLAVDWAKHHLIGTPKPNGRPPLPNLEEVCRAVASEYFARTVGLRQADKRQTLSALLKAYLALNDQTGAKEANDTTIRPYIRYFEAHKDRLMARVSDRQYNDARRKQDFIRALEALRAIGVPVDIEFINQNWDAL